jgi:hypothetical protein
MADNKRGGGLQVIFSVFLGLMVTTFVGVGVWTFHGPPFEGQDRQLEELNREEQAIRSARPESDLTSEDRARLRQITDEQNELRDAADAALEPWGRSTSIILIILATLVMAVSILRADQLPVINNGLLLGGVFTMIYGVGWIVFTDTTVSRFVVMTVALAITLVLGYVRFVRKQQAETALRGEGMPADESLAEILERVQALESRIEGAARALGED